MSFDDSVAMHVEEAVKKGVIRIEERYGHWPSVARIIREWIDMVHDFKDEQLLSSLCYKMNKVMDRFEPPDNHAKDPPLSVKCSVNGDNGVLTLAIERSHSYYAASIWTIVLAPTVAEEAVCYDKMQEASAQEEERVNRVVATGVDILADLLQRDLNNPKVVTLQAYPESYGPYVDYELPDGRITWGYDYVNIGWREIRDHNEARFGTVPWLSEDPLLSLRGKVAQSISDDSVTFARWLEYLTDRGKEEFRQEADRLGITEIMGKKVPAFTWKRMEVSHRKASLLQVLKNTYAHLMHYEQIIAYHTKKLITETAPQVRRLLQLYAQIHRQGEAMQVNSPCCPPVPDITIPQDLSRAAISGSFNMGGRNPLELNLPQLIQLNMPAMDAATPTHHFSKLLEKFC